MRFSKTVISLDAKGKVK